MIVRGDMIAAAVGRSVARKLALALALSAAGGLATQALAAGGADGATVYKRCAACHLPTRAGVPGAFPPLRADIRAFAGSPEGRRYLVLVLARGLGGPIKAEGKTYSGMMPAQSMLSADEVAAVLNLVAEPKVRFTAEEVVKLRASGATLSPAQVAQLNARLTAGR